MSEVGTFSPVLNTSQNQPKRATGDECEYIEGGPGNPEHMRIPAYCCYLSVLTKFTGSHCRAPGPRFFRFTKVHDSIKISLGEGGMRRAQARRQIPPVSLLQSKISLGEGGMRRAQARCQIPPVSLHQSKISLGEGGIRTHGTVSSTHAFQACSFSHSDTSPRICILYSNSTNCKQRADKNLRADSGRRGKFIFLKIFARNCGDGCYNFSYTRFGVDSIEI